MKKLFVLALAISCTSVVVPILTHARAPQACRRGCSFRKPALMTIMGTVKADGDKIMFVNDADGKIVGCDEPGDAEGARGAPRRTQRARVRR